MHVEERVQDVATELKHGAQRRSYELCYEDRIDHAYLHL